MATKTKIGMWVTALLLLFILLPKTHATPFSGNQSPAIRIPASGGLAFDRSGNLWVADVQNSRVLAFMAPFTSNMTPSIVLGQHGFSNTWGSGWYANQMAYPSQVAFDQHGDLWVADTYNSRVTEFIPPFHNGMNASLVIKEPAWSGFAFDPSGNLWVGSSTATSGNIAEYNPPFTASMQPSLVMQGIDTQGDPNLFGLIFDSAGNLWIEAGDILGFDAQAHSVLGPAGRAYFRNDGGLLSPLFSVLCGVALMSLVDGLFNFTIQGLPSGGSVKVKITLPELLPPGVEWLRVTSGNPCGIGEFESSPLPANQTFVEGNNMTLTLTNASREGVISVVGGPAFPGEGITIGSSVPTSSTSISQTQVGPPGTLLSIPSVVVLLAVAIVLCRKRRRR